MKQRLRLGWDVGGWHCDNGPSRDALVLLGFDGQKISLIGKSARFNLAQQLREYRGVSLVRSLVQSCNFSTDESFDLTVAIDTPLGWPESFLSLLRHEGFSSEITFDDAHNPYTRRKTEIDIIEAGFRRVNHAGEQHLVEIVKPLSPVRDMIGSQSTKGLHFIQASGQKAEEAGIFKAQYDDISVTTFEAYPSLARAARNHEVDRTFDQLHDGQDHEDTTDALHCAIIAHLFSDAPKQIAHPLSRYSLIEGRIIYPKPRIASGA